MARASPPSERAIRCVVGEKLVEAGDDGEVGRRVERGQRFGVEGVAPCES